MVVLSGTRRLWSQIREKIMARITVAVLAERVTNYHTEVKTGMARHEKQHEKFEKEINEKVKANTKFRSDIGKLVGVVIGVAAIVGAATVKLLEKMWNLITN